MSESSERGEDTPGSVLSLFRDWYHVPALALVAAFMVAVRLQTYDQFVRNGEVLFSGNDAWYHLREVTYTVRNWPATMPFDPYTYFPFGTSQGQFGTLYDQVVATAALVLGLGSPSDLLVGQTLLVAPAVFGALAAVPTYYIGKRLAGRLAGLFGAVVLALQPGVFLQRTLVGVSDHNGAEPFFQAAAVVFIIAALAVSFREKPVWELVLDRDFEGLRTPLLWSTLAGVATALYMWVWPPGVLLVGIFGLFVLVSMTSEVTNGASPEPIAFTAAVSMGVTAILMLVPLQQLGFSTTRFSLLQPFIVLTVGVGAVFLGFLAREWEDRDLDASLYPVAVFGILAVFLAVLAFAPPFQRIWSLLQTNLLRTVGFSAGAQTRTIGEAQPYLSAGILQQSGLTPVTRILSDYGFTLFTAIIGALWLFGKPLLREGETREVGIGVGALAVVGLIFLVPAIPAGIGSALGVDSSLAGLGVVTALFVVIALLVRHNPVHLFVLVWAAFITSAAFTQVRFNYYLAVPVAVFNAYLIGEVVSYLDLAELADDVSEIKGYQVIAIASAILLILAPVLVVPVGLAGGSSSSTAWQSAQSNGPGAVTLWDGTFDWMRNETPEEGAFGGASADLPYYGTYDETDDFDYPDGSYGVQSWWDYGHWITVQGERIPNANPFQQGAVEAANYLLAPSEEEAESVLEAQSDEGENTRYVMVDWQMATPGSKFGAPIVFYDAGNVSQDQFYSRVFSADLRSGFLLRHQRYYDSTMVRLYEYHGSAREVAPVVVDWDQVEAETRTGETVTVNTAPQGNESLVRQFDSMEEARAFVEEDGSAQIGGVGPFPSERVPALEHYRLVKTSNQSALASGGYQQQYLPVVQQTGIPYQSLTATQHSWVKTFERVPGATVQGSGAPANSVVTASVEMRVPTTGSTFVYRQQAETNADGEFTMTLPYATTGYDQYGPDNGYTNVSVRATGPYQVSTAPQADNESLSFYTSNLTVPEGSVNGAESGDLTVELEETTQSLTVNEDNSSTQGSLSTPAALEPASTTGSSGDVEPDPVPVDRLTVDASARPLTADAATHL